MKKSVGFGVGIACVLLVSACGGGGGGGGSSSGSGGGGTTTTTGGGTTGGTTGPATYEKLSSKAATTSKLTGVAINEAEALKLVQVSGDLTHNTGALNLRAGSSTLNDPNGPDRYGVYKDGTAEAEFITYLDNGHTYEYVHAFYLDEDPYDYDAPVSVGYVGVATEARDVPNSGTATYKGSAAGSYLTKSGGELRPNSYFEDGDSKVKAYFDSGTVNVTVNNFSTYDYDTDRAVTVPFDTVKVTGMKISGNGFSGGQLKTLKNGSQVNLTGSNTTTQATGSFYGYDQSISGPDEVAGAALSRGDNAGVFTSFAAD